MSEPLVGAILAAGRGSRIQPLSDDLPKPLLPLLDQPIIGWQIQRMRALGIREVHVVVGYLGSLLVEELGDGSRWGVELHFIEQRELHGIAHAVGLLEPFLHGRPFVLFLGDIFFEVPNLVTMLDLFRETDADCVLAVCRESDEKILRRNFEVLLDDDRRVREVREKPTVVEGDLKGCGLYLFSAEIFESIRRTPRSGLRGEFELTDSIQVHVDRGFVVRPAEIVERDWNISIPRDLLDLNLHLLDLQGASSYVADSAVLGADVELVKTVVLDDATVEAGARLEKCLVFPGSKVPPGRWQKTMFLPVGALTFE